MTEGGLSPGVLLVRFHPSSGAAGGHWRTNLQPADGTALMAAHRDRQPSITVPGINHRSQVEQCPAVAADAVARELVAVLMQSGDVSQINHGTTLRGGGAHGVSLRRSLPKGEGGTLAASRLATVRPLRRHKP